MRKAVIFTELSLKTVFVMFLIMSLKFFIFMIMPCYVEGRVS
jgi:hypothetical protein